MKNFAAIVFVLLVSWPLLVKIMVVVSWQANRDYIASTLCEKRDIAESNCDGACHLVKQLNKTEDTHTPFPISGLEKIELLPFEVIESQNNITTFIKVHTLGYSKPNLYSFIPQHSIFHPPSIVA